MNGWRVRRGSQETRSHKLDVMFFAPVGTHRFTGPKVAQNTHLRLRSCLSISWDEDKTGPMTIKLMFNLPKPKNDYLVALSTPHGIMQHTMYNLPDPEHGYATDDNARALIVAHLWKNKDVKHEEVLRSLEAGYLRMLKFAQAADGAFYCYISFDLQKKELGIGDWYGRSLFALAYLGYSSKKFEKVSWDILMKSIPLTFHNKFYIRTCAFLIMSYYYLLKKNDQSHVLKKRELDHIMKTLKNWRGQLYKKYTSENSKNWIWPEDKITYDNGKVIQAYLFLGFLLKDDEMTQIGRDMLNFYIEVTMKKGYFQGPGNRGFWEKDKKRPLYDEQAIEAYSFIAALISATDFLHDTSYLKVAETVYMWFWGKNRLGLSLIDKEGGAVFDGLRRDSINTNQGAESYLALNLAYFALTDRIHL